jgi:hypothetical protein
VEARNEGHEAMMPKMKSSDSYAIKGKKPWMPKKESSDSYSRT